MRQHIGPLHATVLLATVLTGCSAATLSSESQDPEAKPPQGDALLDNLQGEWLVTRKIRDETVFNRVVARWVLGARYLRLEYRGCSEPPDYEAIVFLAPSKDGTYLSYWLDSFGAERSAKGEGAAKGQAIEFRYDYESGPFFNTFAWDSPKGEWTSVMESQGHDATRSLFAIDHFTRREHSSAELSSTCRAPSS